MRRDSKRVFRRVRNWVVSDNRIVIENVSDTSSFVKWPEAIFLGCEAAIGDLVRFLERGGDYITI